MSSKKKRRISVPLALDNVQPLSASGEEAAVQQAAEKKKGELAGFAFLSIKPAAADEFPKFLLNALVGKIETIGYNDCPFEEYINLKQPAWGDEAESQYLIVRHCYHDFLTFLSNSFGNWVPGIRLHRTITGTAGIGKTMFALYLARRLFDYGNFVLLYYGQEFWAFTKNELATTHPFNEFLNKKIEANGTKIYYTSGTDVKNDDLLIWMLAQPHVITIRDCGKSEMKWLELAKARIVYVASSGQETFLSLLQKKFGMPSALMIKCSDLWSGMECAWSIKLGLLRLETKELRGHGLDNIALDVEYVLEAYRRYGGSIRNVLAFARELKLQNAEAAALSNFPLSEPTATAISTIVDRQASNQRELAKAKALVFHRSPVGGIAGHRVHFASTFMAEMVTKAAKKDKVKLLNTVVAALSVSGGHQSAYGALYEEEFHRTMMDMPLGENQPRTLHLLGTHTQSSDKVKSMVPKRNPTLDFARTSVLHFPGKSLENASLKSTDDLKSLYFHPLTSNFPTHDSFMVCPASDFFEATTPQDQQRLADSIVLVGLQQTVSGSDDAEDKPSHTVVGQHLVDHLQAFKKIVQKHHPEIKILDDIVTVFVSPSDSCRKMGFMPVLTKDKKKPLETAIQSFAGTAVQYHTVYEVSFIKELMSSNDE